MKEVKLSATNNSAPTNSTPALAGQDQQHSNNTQDQYVLASYTNLTDDDQTPSTIAINIKTTNDET